MNGLINSSCTAFTSIELVITDHCQVPYMLDYSLLPQDRLVIAKAMHIIQSISCVRQVLLN